MQSGGAWDATISRKRAIEIVMASREQYLEKAYGKEEQEKLLLKYRQRKSNHWAVRLKLGEDLFKEYSNWCKETRVEEPSTVLDVGCAIGTFAIEFAKK